MVRVRFRIGFCLAVVATSLIVLGALFTGPIASAADPPANARAIAKVMQIQDRHTNRLMAIPGVVGTATGLNPAGQPVVKVFLAKAGVPGIPAKLEGVPVAVEVTGMFVALPKPEKPSKPDRPGKPGAEKVDPTSRFDRPVPIGVSTGHPAITAGTIGCRVTDGTNVYALSNNHVYADCNNASIGDNVLQPGTYDGGVNPVDAIGTLAYYVDIDFNGGTNYVDAAIATCTIEGDVTVATGTPSDGYGTPASTTVPANDDLLGRAVQKYGRTTSLTKGTVTAYNATVLVGYGGPTALFDGQIIVESRKPFIKPGDSGSLLVTDDDDKNPVGLLFAGNASGKMAVANPIDAVLDLLAKEIDADSTLTIDDTPSE